MLQNIRDNSRSVISFILIGFLVLLFAISGIEALFNWNLGADEAATVNGKKISKLELDRAIQNQKEQILARYGNNVPAEFISDDYLRKPVLEDLIRYQVLVTYAEKSGLAVSQSELMKEIAAEPAFKNEQGVFDNQRYQQLLGMSGLTHSSYLKALTQDQLVRQVKSGLVSSAFTLPYEVDTAVALGFQSRDFSYLQIPVAQLRDSVVVSDEEINEEYQNNSPAYTAEEQIAVDYIELKSSDLKDKISITEEQIRKQYEESLANFVAKPEREAAHILIEGDKPELVKEIGEKISAGEDFATLAKTYSDDYGSKEQGGELGFTDGETFPKEFEETLATLKVGDVSPPVKTDAGIHFIKLMSERGNAAPTFEEQRAVIEDQLKQAEAENLFLAQLERIKEETYNAETLSDVAPALGLEVKNTGLFARGSGKDLAANAKFIEAAFSDDVMQEGNASEPVELEPLHIVVLKKTDHQPKHLRPLEDVQSDIIALLKDKKARETLAQKGQEYIQQLKSGTAFDQVAQTAGYPLKQFTAATRGTVDVDMEILRHAFSMAKPSAEKASVSGATLSNGDYVVINLTEVNPGEKSNLPEEQQSAIVAQLNSVSGKQSLSSFQKLLEDTADIKRN